MIVKKTTKEICKVLTNDRWELDKPKTKYSSAHIKEGFENYEDRVWFSQDDILKQFVPLKEFIVAYTKGKVKQKIIREHLENFEEMITQQSKEA